MLRALAGDEARIEWLYHGVDLARFDGAGRERAAEPRLLAVGRLAPTKGFDDAVRTLAGLRRRGIDARLTLVGDGPERLALEALARELGVAEQVEFAGALTHEALLPLYRRAWALLAPCKVLGGRRDGIPNVVVEAMAMGVPCAGTQAAGLEEIIAPGETGTLTAPGDGEAMAEALAPLLREPVRLDAMGRNARARVVRDFDAAVNFERLAALFAGTSRAVAPERTAAAAVSS
jgi:glycosyltransferase involved in cell wall biosynthesis